MNPVIATGLVSLGKQIVDNVFQPSTQPSQAARFDAALKQAEESASTQAREFSLLRTRLASEPEFYQLAREHGAEGIHLVQDAEGRFALATAEGAQVPLEENSPAAQHAASYARLAESAGLPSSAPAEGPLSTAAAVWKL